MQQQIASFHLAQGLFGINVLLVREINRNLEITRVDRAPPFVVGLMNLRGQIVTVVDLGVRLGMQPRPLTDASCCIVLKTNEELDRMREEGMIDETTTRDIVGLLVDAIDDMVSVQDASLEAPPANIHGVDGRYLSGVIKLEKRLVTTIRLRTILEEE